MHDKHQEFEKNVDQLVLHHDKVKELIMETYECYPKDTARAVYHALHGKHLDEELMCEAFETIVRYDGVHAPFWTVDEFKALLAPAGVNITMEKFNVYDLNFMTQYYYADFKSLGTDPMPFVKIAMDRLHDIDDPEACEAAYREAMKRIKKHKH